LVPWSEQDLFTTMPSGLLLNEEVPMIRDLSQSLCIVLYGVVARRLFRKGRSGLGVASCDDFVMPL